nr:hypothetical protein [Rhodoferax sp.]
MARKSAAALATPTIFSTKRPPPPDGLPPGAAALWVSICAGLDANYFSTGDMVLLESLVNFLALMQVEVAPEKWSS